MSYQPKSDKVSVYDVITEQILSKLAAGVIPWRMAWSVTKNAPRNIKGNVYHGANWFLLSMLGFEDPTFLTFNQARAMGATVRKGSKGFPVIFWKMLVKEDKATGDKEVIPMLRYFTVFHVSQVDGLDYTPRVIADRPTFNTIEAAEKIAQGYNGPTIKHGHSQAFYRKSEDFIGMPDAASFTPAEEYYSTLFHEMAHSTGHESRLNRAECCASHFGSETYSNEELIAECAAAFLCAEAGIAHKTLDNSASYIQNWMKRLSDDPKAFVSAAGKAQKAADYILNRVAVVETSDDESEKAS